MNSHYDYIAIGSGIAGLHASLLAKEYGSVLLLTKESIEECNTLYAQGGIAAAIGPEDSPELHFKDTLEAGVGICNIEAAALLTSDGPNAIRELIKLGMVFDTVHGSIALGQEAAHRVPRILHAGGDATGAHIETTLSNLSKKSKIQIQEHSLVTKILINEHGRADGVEVFDKTTNQTNIFHGKHIILASGGAGQLFKYTTNPKVATGEGVALAFIAGAAVMDMEFYQFHPTALHLNGAPHFLISEAVRGEGGILRDPKGIPFMKNYHELADLAPRDVVARAVSTEMHKYNSENVYLDTTHLASKKIVTRFPNIYKTCLEYGIDITKDLIPVTSAAHYMIGGVLINTRGETSIPGLYACGEVTCSGLHGANRLASNSLLETVVFGRRLIQATIEDKWQGPEISNFRTIPNRKSLKNSEDTPTLEKLQAIMWNNVGISRNYIGLIEAAVKINELEQHERLRDIQKNKTLQHTYLLGRLMAESALIRTESRGAHYRTDFPATSSDWNNHIVLKADS
jgi:L-aspartate oxidase